MALDLLSAGAAQGLVEALAARFERETGTTIAGTFGAVGLMKEKVEGGAPCDVIVLSEKLMRALAADRRVDATTVASLGSVPTGIAVRAGDPLPAIADADALRASLLAADAIHFPDPSRATAGIHFAGVLEKLGIARELADRVRTFPNGATAMRELARSGAKRPIGCTQASEIVHTPGLALVGPLPAGYDLTTTYAAGVVRGARSAEAARALVRLLTADDTRELRRRAGFEA